MLILFLTGNLMTRYYPLGLLVLFLIVLGIHAVALGHLTAVGEVILRGSMSGTTLSGTASAAANPGMATLTAAVVGAVVGLALDPGAAIDPLGSEYDRTQFRYLLNRARASRQAEYNPAAAAEYQRMVDADRVAQYYPFYFRATHQGAGLTTPGLCPPRESHAWILRYTRFSSCLALADLIAGISPPTNSQVYQYVEPTNFPPEYYEIPLNDPFNRNPQVRWIKALGNMTCVRITPACTTASQPPKGNGDGICVPGNGPGAREMISVNEVPHPSQIPAIMNAENPGQMVDEYGQIQPVPSIPITYNINSLPAPTTGTDPIRACLFHMRYSGPCTCTYTQSPQNGGTPGYQEGTQGTTGGSQNSSGENTTPRRVPLNPNSGYVITSPASGLVVSEANPPANSSWAED